MSTPRELRSTCVAQWAANHWGGVTTEQLGRCGVSSTTIGRWVGDRRLHRLLRGVYAVGHVSPGPEQRWQAALLAYGDDAVLTRCVSLALHGLGRPPKEITVAVPREVRAQRGVRPHFLSVPFERGEVVIRRGLRTTSIERTLLDLAATGEPIERLVAEATAKRLTSIAKLKDYHHHRAGARGAARLRRCIEAGQTRSGAEKEFAAWLEAQGIPTPEFNVPFGPYTSMSSGPSDGWWSKWTPTSLTAFLLARGLRTIRVTPRQWRERPLGLRGQLAADL